MDSKPSNDLLWLVSVAGLVLGAIVTIVGLALLDDGAVPLIVGLIFLAFGGAAFFVRARG